MPTKLHKLAIAWDIFERTILSALVVGMVLLSGLQIVLRNVFQTGIAWVEPVLGASVLWITMLGALAATGSAKHIKIDLVSHFFAHRISLYVAATMNLFASVVCGYLLVAGIRYVRIQREMAVLSSLRTSTWILYFIVPLCFGLMTFRFVLQAVVRVVEARTGLNPPPHSREPTNQEGA